MKQQKFWIAVISNEHAQRGIEGNFIQVCHGKPAPLKRMQKDDWMVIYSPKLSMDGDEKCQRFTGIGQVLDDEVYPYQMSENFIPFRRNIGFQECRETSILPLINDLDFILNKKSWGYPFRFGFFEIQESDFNLISSKLLEYEISR